MKNTTEDENKIVLYLLHSNKHFQSILKPYDEIKTKLLETEDRMFHEEIETQYKTTRLWLMIKDIAENTGTSTEDIIIVLEQINLDEYFKT